MYNCTKLVKCITEFLKNRNIRSKIKRSKVTDYAALKYGYRIMILNIPYN